MTAMRRLVMGSIDFMSLTISPGILYFAYSIGRANLRDE
jgi:hypothetical protein